MLRMIRNCTKFAGRKKNFSKKKSSKIKFKTLPVFQYPISSDGDHRVYVWGLADHGALGTTTRLSHGDSFSFITKPSRLSFGEYHKVVDVVCGYGFSAFAVSSKDKSVVYGSGINTDSQLGFDQSDLKHPDGILTVPRPIHLPLKGTTTKVLGLAAGRAHLLVLTSEGLYTLGNNGYGQCGRPIINNESYTNSSIVHHIPDIKGTKITSVTAGQDHSILLTEKGEVYTFGWGADGQTGLAHYRNEYRPSLVKGDLAGQNIIKIACVADCVLAISDKGKVFGWGNSEYSQLSIKGESQQVNIATELEFCQQLGHVVDVAAGGSYCMALNNAGDVFVWGYGILGLGPEVQKILKPTQIPSTLFGRNAYDQTTRVRKIYSGISHLAAVTNTGDLYMWGRNKFGYLGLGHRNDQYFPLKVSVGAQVKKVSCGVDHTVTLCRPFI